MNDLDKLIDIQKQYRKLHESSELEIAGMDESRIHLMYSGFIKAFEDYEVAYFDGNTLKLITYYKGVRFIALVKENEI